MSNDNGSAPQWFVDALAAPVETGRTDVDGASISYRAWGEAGRPGVVLVHGGMAHSRWWDHIGPQLAAGRRVVALDLSGHGDSDHREDYSLDAWAAEVLAVAAAGGIDGRPVLIGHSMGGIVSFAASHLHGDRLAGVVILDSPIRDLTPEELELRIKAVSNAGPPKVYPTVEAAVARFRLVPPQEQAEPYVFDHIARNSLKQVDGGYSWKFDNLRMGREHRRSLEEMRQRCPLAYFRCEHGIIGDALFAQLRNQFGPDALVTELPAAGHHPMIDRPLAVVAAVRTVLAAWHHPRR
ncbi:MAG: alpha/beta hydrolase [Rhodococcus sp.]|uniref:alpha/beta fold hydrolase n=1 Tax=Rhodococcus sp. TaxID=1831 RepID=UPI001697129B|nr:alpha/beta hydrolase [Rhodococcus sp. (in: high G+C Gram-positive bacteria)]NLV79219.1 alpha/beta hydrolase [Rhodococcus sp. (in: high G+C Gram-positive bacteria)]